MNSHHHDSITINPCRGVAQPGSASGLGPEGREFESHRPDQFDTVIQQAYILNDYMEAFE